MSNGVLLEEAVVEALRTKKPTIDCRSGVAGGSSLVGVLGGALRCAGAFLTLCQDCERGCRSEWIATGLRLR